jgi:hypothetical protein
MPVGRLKLNQAIFLLENIIDIGEGIFRIIRTAERGREAVCIFS